MMQQRIAQVQEGGSHVRLVYGEVHERFNGARLPFRLAMLVE